VAAMVLPTTALAYNWYRSPESPLVVGGIHSTGAFKHVVLNHRRVQLAIKDVLAADHAPSWVYAVAISAVKAGAIRSDSLPRGKNIGAMAFGPHTTRIVKNTVWRGTGRLPYYYVNSTQSVVQNGYRVDTTYRVALAKTCGNPFVLGPYVTRTPVMYNLYVEKRSSSATGPRLAGWIIRGTVGTKSVEAVTSSSDKVLVGSFPAGTAIDLSEGEAPGQGVWNHVTPADGRFITTMPAQDMTLTFVNVLVD
jgi:hypothetical protein